MKIAVRGLTIDEANYLHSLYSEEDKESRIPLALELTRMMGGTRTNCNLATANLILASVLNSLLTANQKLVAAALCWGDILFNVNARSCRLIFARLQTKPALLIYGSSGLGKSYTVIGEKLLDWCEDPQGTTVKLCSTTAAHAKAQTFSTLVRLHESSAVPLPGIIQDGFIGIDSNDERSSITEVAIDKGQGKGAKLQGFHPLPRSKPHPKFGSLTRVRGVFDEAEQTPDGLWKGEANMMSVIDEELHVQIVAMWNPDDIGSEAAERAAPKGGYDMLDERLEEYESAKGYHVIRVDARKSENVIHKRIVIPGIQTYGGLRRLEDAGGNDLMTFGYGLYPREIVSFGIISRATMDKCRGNFVWCGKTTEVSSLDMAEEGPDRAVYSCGKYGPTMLFRPEHGPEVHFKSIRYCLQIEQQIELVKRETLEMAEEVIFYNKKLFVRPEWFALDCTSSVTMRDWIKRKWGEIIGVKWGEGATERPILWESKEKASDLYLNVKTEMWFALGAWAQFGYLAFSPNMETNELFSELTSMRYRHVGKLLKRCEKTSEYKKRMGGKSPDHAASSVMMVHVARAHADVQKNPAMEPEARRIDPSNVSDQSEILEDIYENDDAIEFIY